MDLAFQGFEVALGLQLRLGLSLWKDKSNTPGPYIRSSVYLKELLTWRFMGSCRGVISRGTIVNYVGSCAQSASRFPSRPFFVVPSRVGVPEVTSL